jgi:hypothetical protein
VVDSSKRQKRTESPSRPQPTEHETFNEKDEIKEDPDSEDLVDDSFGDEDAHVFLDDEAEFAGYAAIIIRLEQVVLGTPTNIPSEIERHALRIYNSIEDVIEKDRGAPRLGNYTTFLKLLKDFERRDAWRAANESGRMAAWELRQFRDRLFEAGAPRYGFAEIPETYDFTVGRLWKLGKRGIPKVLEMYDRTAQKDGKFVLGPLFIKVLRFLFGMQS